MHAFGAFLFSVEISYGSDSTRSVRPQSPRPNAVPPDLGHLLVIVRDVVKYKAKWDLERAQRRTRRRRCNLVKDRNLPKYGSFNKIRETLRRPQGVPCAICLVVILIVSAANRGGSMTMYNRAQLEKQPPAIRSSIRGLQSPLRIGPRRADFELPFADLDFIALIRPT